MATGSAGSPTVATMTASPALVPPVTDPAEYIGTVGFRFPNCVQACICCEESNNPCKPRGSSFDLGGVSFGQLLRQALDDQVLAGSDKAVKDGTVKKPAIGVV